jgi:hypothetical protein
MPHPTILSYSDVLAETDERRHLLLGNGFSISCRPDVFTYGKLFERADFTNLTRARQAFDALSTRNFESVIRTLRNFALLASVYAPGDADGKARAGEDADALREVLVGAVANSHPDRPHDIQSSEYLKCREFLRGYKSINTLNYDHMDQYAGSSHRANSRRVAAGVLSGFRVRGHEQREGGSHPS